MNYRITKNDITFLETEKEKKIQSKVLNEFVGKTELLLLEVGYINHFHDNMKIYLLE